MTDFFDEHLTLDAIVAFADGEMAMLPYQRAGAHLARCPRCSAEVAEQQLARQWLRTAQAPRMPSGLLASLRSIPVAAPQPDELMPPADPGSPLDGSGAAARPGRLAGTAPRTRRFRLGAGAVVAGLAVGAVLTGMATDSPIPRPSVYDPLIAQIGEPDDRGPGVQQIRFGPGN